MVEPRRVIFREIPAAADPYLDPAVVAAVVVPRGRPGETRRDSRRAQGVDAVHFSARSVRPGGMVFRNPHVSMGGCGDVSEYDLLCADERLIRQILTLLEP